MFDFLNNTRLDYPPKIRALEQQEACATFCKGVFRHFLLRYLVNVKTTDTFEAGDQCPYLVVVGTKSFIDGCRHYGVDPRERHVEEGHHYGVAQSSARVLRR